MIFDTLPLMQKSVLRFWLLMLTAILLPVNMLAQSDAGIKFKGQLSGWGSYSSGAEFPVMVGGRYLPQFNLELPFRAKTESKGIMQADSGAAATGQVLDSEGLNVDSARKLFGIKGLRFDAEVAGKFFRKSGDVWRRGVAREWRDRFCRGLQMEGRCEVVQGMGKTLF